MLTAVFDFVGLAGMSPNERFQSWASLILMEMIFFGAKCFRDHSCESMVEV